MAEGYSDTDLLNLIKTTAAGSPSKPVDEQKSLDTVVVKDETSIPTKQLADCNNCSTVIQTAVISNSVTSFVTDTLSSSCMTVEDLKADVTEIKHREDFTSLALQFDPDAAEKLGDFDLLSKEELIFSLQECRTELDLTKKELEKTKRQLQKSNDYNIVLRNMVFGFFFQKVNRDKNIFLRFKKL